MFLTIHTLYSHVLPILIICDPISLSSSPFFDFFFVDNVVEDVYVQHLMCVYKFMIIVDHFMVLIYAPFLYNNVIICILIECMRRMCVRKRILMNGKILSVYKQILLYIYLYGKLLDVHTCCIKSS